MCVAAESNLELELAGPRTTRVLVVEDQEVIRELLETVFEREGFETTCAGTVREGLSHLHAGTDFVILDLHLPDGAGTEVLRRIRRERLSAKVAVTTGTIDAELLSAAARLRPERMFQKPYRATDLVAWIRAAGPRGKYPFDFRSADPFQ